MVTSATPTRTPASTYRIGDLAREFDITPRAIRYYETQGLIAPERHGQARVYYERDRVRLKLVLRGKRLGFSISEIAEILNLYDAPEGESGQTQHVLSKLTERRAALESQRADIDAMLEKIKRVEQRVAVGYQYAKGL
jgi:DNA-binding transcriptional MerR regulator